MSIQINCDRCKRFMKFVSKKELNSMEDNVLCKICLQTQDKLTRDMEQLKNRAMNDFTQRASKWKELVDEAISKRIAEEK